MLTVNKMIDKMLTIMKKADEDRAKYGIIKAELLTNPILVTYNSEEFKPRDFKNLWNQQAIMYSKHYYTIYYSGEHITSAPGKISIHLNSIPSEDNIINTPLTNIIKRLYKEYKLESITGNIKNNGEESSFIMSFTVLKDGRPYSRISYEVLLVVKNYKYRINRELVFTNNGEFGVIYTKRGTTNPYTEHGAYSDDEMVLSKLIEVLNHPVQNFITTTFREVIEKEAIRLSSKINNSRKSPLPLSP